MNSVKKFIKKKENFICEFCGFAVKGSGYTNHCTKCLTSKHIDIFPGDRLEQCGGKMEITSVEQGKNKIILEFTCKNCQEKSKDHFRENEDDFDVLLEKVKVINKNK